MTLPLSPTTYVDGELVTAANLYARVLTPINTIYAQISSLPQGLLVKQTRTVGGTGIGGAESMLSLLSQAAFTLTTTRRVRWIFQLLLDTPSTSNIWPQVNVRRNNTGAAVATSDQRVAAARNYLTNAGTGQSASLSASGSELLTAGTYAYGLGFTTGAGTTCNLAAASDFPSTLEVYDMGAT